LLDIHLFAVETNTFDCKNTTFLPKLQQKMDKNVPVFGIIFFEKASKKQSLEYSSFGILILGKSSVFQ
jgi:hypothetical protein